MSDNQALYTEEAIIGAVKRLLAGRVNELLGEVEFLIPPIELTHKSNGGYYAVTPELGISTCERSEKDRIVLLDAYKVTIIFTCPELNGERNCYAYAASVDRALREDPTLGGVADYALLIKKDYRGPKHPGTGEPWETELKIHVLVDF
ncbi:MAG: hypothetical protein LBQ88_23105 [Treponema sp.]|jgi:hypothetical protein|nr:hypothetical protein [Treponema sp.]